jgi:hypothetical protein
MFLVDSGTNLQQEKPGHRQEKHVDEFCEDSNSVYCTGIAV